MIAAKCFDDLDKWLITLEDQNEEATEQIEAVRNDVQQKKLCIVNNNGNGACSLVGLSLWNTQQLEPHFRSNPSIHQLIIKAIQKFQEIQNKDCTGQDIIDVTCMSADGLKKALAYN